MEESARPVARHGVVAGRFLPPHAGHVDLIERARARVERLTVMCAAREGDPIDVALRLRWLRELFVHAPNVTVDAIEEADGLRARSIASSADVLFSCDDDAEVAGRLRARLVVLARRIDVVSSAVRAAPCAHWGSLPEPVRPFLAKRIVITGPESTGKTTLAEQLAARYRTSWVPEFARGYLDEVNARRTVDAICLREDLDPIARGQIATEDEAASRANRAVFCDTDALSTKIYAEHYFGEGACPPWIARLARERRADLHLLLDVDVPWVPDPQRDRPQLRDELHAIWRRELAAAGRRVVEIRGGWDERFAGAVSAVDEILRLPIDSATPRGSNR